MITNQKFPKEIYILSETYIIIIIIIIIIIFICSTSGA